MELNFLIKNCFYVLLRVKRTVFQSITERKKKCYELQKNIRLISFGY